MTDWFGNNIKVFGKEKDLELFKNDTLEGGENILSFRKIIPTLEEYSVWKKEKIYPEILNWEYSDWDLQWDANFLVKNRKNCFIYIFDTPGGIPIQIFLTLINRYRSLNFEIISYFYFDVILEMESVQGKLKKFSEYFFENIKLPDGKFDQIWFEQNYMKNKTLLLEEPRLYS